MLEGDEGAAELPACFIPCKFHRRISGGRSNATIRFGGVGLSDGMPLETNVFSEIRHISASMTPQSIKIVSINSCLFSMGKGVRRVGRRGQDWKSGHLFFDKTTLNKKSAMRLHLIAGCAADAIEHLPPYQPAGRPEQGTDLPMNEIARRRIHGATSFLAFVATATLLAACASDNSAEMGRHHGKEYFSEKAYGVKASPRVSFLRSHLPRGGGREQVGDPYEVAGKWYYPQDYRRYSAVGAASWYGDAFHGRLTANGEVYDDTNLTAAHPTLPLPSYARVTNLLNGSSVIVRVNDRGPYAPGRIIDLSKHAAELLDYGRTGVAKVRVDYIGKAPLDGNDERFLLASYHPGEGGSAPGENPGVMIAMNGSTPAGRHASPSFPVRLDDEAPVPTAPTTATRSRAAVALAAMGETSPRPLQTTVAQADIVGPNDPVLPTICPIVPYRPDRYGSARIAANTMQVLSYADSRIERANAAFGLIVRDDRHLTPAGIVASWKRGQMVKKGRGDVAAYVAVGSFASHREAAGYSADLSRFGRAEIKPSKRGGATFYSLALYPDGHASIDRILKEAWADGATDAMTVRE